MLKKLFDTYTLVARFFPAIITAIPVFVLYHFFSKNPDVNELAGYLFGLEWYGEITLAIVLLYFWAELIRTTSKYFEKKYFIKRNGFPTTYFMLYENDEFTYDYKDRYRVKVKSLLGIDLYNKVAESSNIKEATKKLNEATKEVILKVGNGKLVIKHNIWYGFFRNLIGGSIYAIFVCVINAYIGYEVLNNDILLYSSAVLFFFFLGILLFNKRILIQHAEAYAKQLIAEFLSL